MLLTFRTRNVYYHLQPACSQALLVQPLTHGLSSITSLKIPGLIFNQSRNWAQTADWRPLKIMLKPH